MFNIIMEGKTMTLARFSDDMFPSIPSFFDRFLGRDWMDWSNTNYSSTNTTLPAVNIKEDDDALARLAISLNTFLRRLDSRKYVSMISGIPARRYCSQWEHHPKSCKSC